MRSPSVATRNDVASPSADDDFRAAFLADVKAKLQPYVDDQGLAFPIESNVALAEDRARLLAEQR